MEAGALNPGARRGRTTTRITAGVVLAAVALGVGLGFALHGILGRAAAPPSASVVVTRHGLDGEATWAPGIRPAPAITRLVDQDGRHFALSALRGRTVAMVFVDSHCNQQCPLEGRELAAAERALPAGQRPVLVAVSVNPLDTPASVRRAARQWGLAAVSGWHWLLGTRARLAPVWAAYHIYVGPEVNGDVPHTEAVLLVDRRGYERSAFLYPFNQSFVTHDLRVLGAGEGRA